MRRRAFGLRPVPPCRHGHSASVPHAFAPAALRAALASRGSAQGPSPPRAAWRPSMLPNWRCRIGPASAPPRWTGSWRTRWGLLRQVVRMRAVLNAGGSRPSRYEGRFTDIPPGIAMELPRHASRPAPQGAAGAFSLVVGSLTWPASVGKPAQPSCGDAESALSPFGAVRPKASLCCCESWRWRGCASGFMAATVQRKQFPLRCAHSSRDKFFSPPGSPLRCDRKRCSQPVPRRPDHNKDAMGANLAPSKGDPSGPTSAPSPRTKTASPARCAP